MSPVQVLKTPVKSENDKKSYRAIRLENGLKALLISAPPKKQSSSKNEPSTSNDENGNKIDDEKLAACAVCVDVGHFSDPSDVQGMAHFLGMNFFFIQHFTVHSGFNRLFVYSSLIHFVAVRLIFTEHLILMGSEKYPNENEFEQFLQNSGGGSNASTRADITTFHFDVREQLLDDALDRFSYLFKAPLLRKDSMMREREAVDSEFSMRKNNEFVQRRQILSSLAQPGHPFGKFDCGNLKSLKDDIDDEILYEKVHNFRKRHYLAHRMYVCIQAEQSLDSLQVNLNSFHS